MEATMLGRFAPLLLVAFLVLAVLGVFVIQKVLSDRDPCSELLAEFEGLYPQTGKLSEALRSKMNLCDYSIQLTNAERAFLSHVEAAEGKCLPFGIPLDDFGATFGRGVLARMQACHAAAIDPGGALEDGVMSTELVPPEKPPCKQLIASLIQNPPPDRAFKAFESHSTKKTYCDFLSEFSNSEQAIIDRLESAGLDCGALGTLKTNHAETLERRTQACDAAVVDPDGLVTSNTR
jgi:hypothetical protein